MLPSILAGQLQQGLADYIRTTFPMTNPAFQGSIDNMLVTKDSVFHEPYVAVRLPFRNSDHMPDMFHAIHPPYMPFVHQQKAFERLTGDDGRSTLIATGTGSGKTECFLYPILEYCYRHRGEKGIKALIIYPMNALASDQAKRIAELIYYSPELHNQVTAGMYVGGYESSPSRGMSEDQVITDHETMLASPPDILLTNYKMLDYLLVRPKDATLWQDNKPDTLKYIAVDELHTFDGAQGTDLACLLRRLKARLFTPQGYLCCIGTSATMGNKDSAENVKEYASLVFGEPFEPDSVITEDRLSAGEFLAGQEMIDFTLPSEADLDTLSALVAADDEKGLLEAAIRAWFDDSFVIGDVMSDTTRLAIGEHLMVHAFTHSLLHYIGGNYMQPSFIYEGLRTQHPLLARLTNPSLVLDALFALISHARTGSEGKLRPLLTVQVQVWMRELRRLLAKVSEDDITYAVATDLNDEQSKQYLPVINCRDCGETGWVSLANERGNLTLVNLETFYNLFFRQDEKVVMVFPHQHADIAYQTVKGYLCPDCLELHIGDGDQGRHCSCGAETIQVILPKLYTSGSKSNKQYVCPFCGSRRGLSIIGLRSATAISATVSQLFASKFNDDKKTLAFSDNVQDAAHRAGFFNSRTWRFGLRSAIQRYTLAEGDGKSLADFSEGFIDYWHSNLSDEEFVSLFIAPNMTWMRAYEKMKKEGKLSPGRDAKKLIGNIQRRLRYEILLEYGLSSRIGRTLEKSDCSVIAFDSIVIEQVAARVRDRTINEIGMLHKVEDRVFELMITGFLNTMRSYGAFNDPVFGAFTNNEGKSYLLSNDKERWLPGLQSGRNTPRFICEPTGTGKRLYAFDMVSYPKYAGWLEACVDEVLISENLFDNIAKLILEELVKSGLVVAMPSPAGYKVWALDKEKIYISKLVKQLACDICGSTLSVAEENQNFWEDAPCLRSKCSGYLQLSYDASLGYYGKLFSNGDMVRVMAKEHTGLLERDDREELERVFKHSSDQQKPWDANLLSCTPTLEMGIDIGDLSTVILCSIPPAQAQFLQRVGRAGRKDGNALTIAVANARPHDLYFYAEPMEMIDGVVEPPKVFLKASAVLERQFVAYCLDCWIKKGVPEKAIPKNVGMCLTKLNNRPADLFPFNFLIYVQNNISSLLRTFLQIFGQNLDEATIAELHTFAEGNGLADSPMHMKIFDAFESLKKQRDVLADSIKDLKTLIKELEAKPQDPEYDQEIKELKRERQAILNVVKNLQNKDVFNFLSDEGLLPNYAFPEAGIILKAVLYRRDDSDPETPEEVKKKKYEKMVYEYNRSASAAISEFAPCNNFYVDGRKLTINQVDLTTAQPAPWRLCPNCSHAQIEETGKFVGSCPQCGSAAWTDTGQVRTMLKVQMVYSNMDYTKSLIGDESEERQSTFYCRQMLVDVDEDNDINKAYRMDNEEFVFGYEFVKKATMREINFGESDIVGERLTVAGTEEIRKGFKICKHCGKLQIENEKPEHTYTCKSRNAQPGNGDPYEECLFLYREFATEALRLLVPATTMDSSNVRVESFTAAFMLGMKEYFGNVDHLRACLSEVPVIDADYRKQYLVIYDSVPGGTGYLKQLMQHDTALIEIFEKALAVLENCNCKDDPQKDGCYRCLYAYRQSQNIGQISRNMAIRLLKQILSGKGNLEEIPKLGNIPVNSLFESELERMFIEALDKTSNVTKELVNNKEGYLLKIGDSRWEVEPQVVLDNEHGVSVKSRADFVLWPVRKSEGQMPVAVFTDGFSYHKDIAADDTLKREAIRRCNKFRVWSLSWKDIKSVFQNQGDYATTTLDPEKMPCGNKVYKPTIEAGNAQDLKPNQMSAFEILLHYLENPTAEDVFVTHAKAYAISLLEPLKQKDSSAFFDWQSKITPIVDILDLPGGDFETGKTLFGEWIPRQSESHLTILSGVDIVDMQTNKGNAGYLVCSTLDDAPETITDKYEAEWNGFWQFFNIMQFLPGFAAVSATGMSNLVYNAILATDLGDQASPSQAGGDWAEIVDQIFDQAVRAYANELVIQGVPAPSAAGYELIGPRGAIIAECELAWEREKIALVLPDQIDGKGEFEENGWTVISLGDSVSAELFQGGAIR